MFPSKYKLCFVDFETTGLGPDDKPIEIGAILCDHNLAVISKFHCLIKWPSFFQMEEWPERMQGAFKIHKIPVAAVLNGGMYPSEAREGLRGFIKDYRSPGDKIYMVSDNVVFETRMMLTLFGICGDPFNAESDPFHYRAYDTSLMFQLMDVVKVYNTNTKNHRAMDDAEQLLANFRDAVGRFNAG